MNETLALVGFVGSIVGIAALFYAIQKAFQRPRGGE